MKNVAGFAAVAASFLSALGNESVVAKIGEILKPHAEELTTLINADIDEQHTMERQSLEERFFIALVRGTSQRRDLTADDALTLSLRSRELAHALLFPLCASCVANGRAGGCGAQIDPPPIARAAAVS
jgi:hypothetical protein